LSRARKLPNITMGYGAGTNALRASGSGFSGKLGPRGASQDLFSCFDALVKILGRRIGCGRYHIDIGRLVGSKRGGTLGSSNVIARCPPSPASLDTNRE